MTGDWSAAVRIVTHTQKNLSAALDKAVAMEAHHARAAVIRGIQKQAPEGKTFQKLSMLTREIRKAQGFKGRKALIRSGALVQSIAVRKRRQGHYFMGVLRGAKNKDGKELADIAGIQEHGATFVIRVTPKMRRFLMAMLRRVGRLDKRKRRPKGAGKKQRGVADDSGSSIGKRFMIVKIPARPFIKPVIDAIASDPIGVRKRLEARVSRTLGYKLGKV